MNRRFVNLVTHKWADRVYYLRRIDPSHVFFYRSAKVALEAADEAAKGNVSFPAMQPLELPPSNMGFVTNPSGGGYDLFALLSSRPACEGRMIYASTVGDAMLYDADKQLISTMGSLNKPKGSNPVCLSIVNPGNNQDSLYVMGRYPGQAAGGCFEVLEYASEFPELSDVVEPTWRWRLLPPPPFVRQPGYKLSPIISYTTILDSNGYSTICVSCNGDTYSFETARRDSSHHLGRRQSEKWKHLGWWMLPFNGRAQYAPEFDLWFGFSASSPNNLCAADLSAMDADRQPTVQQDWQDVNLPDGEVWLPMRLELLNLGHGKFLIAKTFQAEATTRQRFAVLTGVEIMRDVYDGKRLQMVKHKCACYAFTNETIYWVL
jgi:hypothetical protein